jgi:hypothetical protein
MDGGRWESVQKKQMSGVKICGSGCISEYLTAGIA